MLGRSYHVSFTVVVPFFITCPSHVSTSYLKLVLYLGSGLPISDSSSTLIATGSIVSCHFLCDRHIGEHSQRAQDEQRETA